MTAMSITLIRERFAEQRRTRKARHRDIAAAVAISEGELVAAHADAAPPEPAQSMTATRLRAEWPALIEGLEPVGPVMALTRNESCVHEKTGVYANASHHGPVGLVLGGAIDLRVFYQRWAHGFAVEERTDGGPQRSLQFFDAAGTAIHKVFVRPQTDLAAWQALVARFVAADQRAGISVQPAEPAEPERADAQIDVPALRAAWAGLRDTHEFFGLLKAHGVSRVQALRLADPQFARRVDAGVASRALNGAAHAAVPIMVFVGNPGMIQIHGGPVSKVVTMGPWLNVLDDGFNLHLREDHIASAWIVGKPTSDGLVTSIELFDAAGATIAMLFGERKPGTPELASWRALVAALDTEAAPCAA